MILQELLNGVDYVDFTGDKFVKVSSITSDSKNIVKNGLFVCLTGENYDGHDYYLEAENFGASAIVTKRKLQTNLPQIIVKDTRKAYSELSANLYQNPEKRLKIVGVTGTNGKTTVTHMIKHILSQYGIKCGIIGTLGAYFCNEHIELGLTTPDPPELFSILKKMVDSGIEVVLMEVSAHASALKKVDAIDFYLGIFTNLTQDHLDYFSSMENYKKAKLSFINEKRCKYIISNSDDEVGREILKNNEKALSYGLDNPADVFAIKLKTNKWGESFFINLFDTVEEVNLKIFGKFNIYNALASVEASSILGVPSDFAIKAISSFKGVDGRLEKVNCGKFSAFIDYAHTPDGLEKSIQTVKKLTKNKVICVFGCGGNRDKIKRKIMGAISAKNADFTIITSDNPRFEEPMSIIKEIEKGVMEIGGKFATIENRHSAIEYALNIAGEGDSVLIAGKGSEKYQEILGFKQPFDDKSEVLKSIKKVD